MMIKIIFHGTWRSANEIITDERKGRFVGAKARDEELSRAVAMAMIWKTTSKIDFPITEKVDFAFMWFAPNKRKDPDGLTWGKKVIIDSLVTAGILSDDGWENTGYITHDFDVDKDDPRVEVEIALAKKKR